MVNVRSLAHGTIQIISKIEMISSHILIGQIKVIGNDWYISNDRLRLIGKIQMISKFEMISLHILIGKIKVIGNDLYISNDW